MRVLITTYGSRGDVQPMVALGLALQARNVDVRISAPPDPELVDLVARNALRFDPAFASVKDWVARARASGLKLPKLSRLMIAGQFDILDAAADGCDAIVATGLFPSRAAAQAVAERRGLVFASVHFCPQYLPSPDLPPVAFPGWPHPQGVTGARALWAHNAEAMNGLFGEAVNAHRVSIGLAPVGDVRERAFTQRPWLAADPVLGPWRPSDLCDGVQTGAWILADTRPLPPDLTAFLDDGAPPVYCGFGSMTLPAAADAARAAIEAIRAHGRRALIARGVAGLGAIDGRGDCFVVGEVNQQALFPRVAAAIHHGGAGTTATVAKAGIPQVIVPQVADQPYWGARVASLGIGAAYDGPMPSFASLVAALGIALAAAARARALAPDIRGDGAEVAAGMLLNEIAAARAARR